MSDWNNVWIFGTRRFVVSLDWTWEDSPDLSWDETGETQEKCESGEWTCCMFRVRVLLDGREIGCDYLGNSVYADPREFYEEHLGVAAKARADNCNYGCYFTDMVHEAVRQARDTLRAAPRVRCA